MTKSGELAEIGMGAWRRRCDVCLVEDTATSYGSNECCMQCYGYQRVALSVATREATEDLDYQPRSKGVCMHSAQLLG